MGKFALRANSVSDKLDSLYRAIDTIIDKARNGTFSYPDVEELQAFVKSCNQDLSGDIGKLLKLAPGKKAETVKLAKAIQTTTALYAKNLQKLTGEDAIFLAKEHLAPALLEMQKVAANAIKDEALKPQDVEPLKKAQKRWSNNKVEVIVECKKLEAKEIKQFKESLKDLKDDLSDIKILKRDDYSKLLTGLTKIDALPEVQLKSTAQRLLPPVQKMVDEMERFAVTDFGTKKVFENVDMVRDANTELLRAFSDLLSQRN